MVCRTFRTSPRRALCSAGVLSLLLPQAAMAASWDVGDVFVGVSNGTYQVYDNNGVFKETISDGLGGFTTGCAFNPDLSRLYTTNFSNTKVVVYDDPHPHPIVQVVDTNATSPGGSSESVVFDAAGNFYVGHADGNADVHKYDPTGTLLATFNVATEARGSDWLDLAADQITLFYTSEGRQIKRFDTSANAQLADYVVLPGSGIAFALRLLPPGDGTGGLLVADSSDVKRVDSGGVLQTYDATGEDSWFSLNLDPNGTSFWAGNFASGNFYRFDIATGAIEVGPINTGTGAFTLFGICVKGELTAAIPELTLTPADATNAAGTDHTVTATLLAAGQPVEGTLIRFEVIAGPNTGEVSDPLAGECTPNDDCTTDAAGMVSWTYTSNGAVGTDTIEACFDDAAGSEHCVEATKTWVDRTPPEVACIETVNPHGQNVPPAGSTTLPGSHGGQNDDGFYELRAVDNVDPNPQIFVLDTGSGTLFGPFPSGTRIKYTEANGATPKAKPMGSDTGSAGAIDWHIFGTGDAQIRATDAAGNTSSAACLVPPPPK